MAELRLCGCVMKTGELDALQLGAREALERRGLFLPRERAPQENAGATSAAKSSIPEVS